MTRSRKLETLPPRTVPSTKKPSLQGGYKLVVEWVLEQIRSGDLQIGDTRTFQQVAEAGPFNLSQVRKAFKELSAMGVVSNSRSVGAKVTGVAPSDWKRRGRITVAVLAPPDTRMIGAVLAGVAAALDEPTKTHKLAAPELLTLWPAAAGRSGEIERRRLLSQFDGLIPLPCFSREDRLVLNQFLQGSGLPCAPIESPAQGAGGSPAFTVNAFESGETAARYLLVQLRFFQSIDAVAPPPVYIFSEHPASECLETLLGCEEVLQADPALFWTRSEYLRSPDDIKAKQPWLRNWLGDLEDQTLPHVSGQTAGRFFASGLIHQWIEHIDGGQVVRVAPSSFVAPRCGVICLSGEVGRGAVQAFAHAGFCVGRDVFVIAVDHRGADFGSFLTRVETDYRELGRLAGERLASQIFLRSKPSGTVGHVAPVLRRRRSTSGFLHKLWRSNPGPTVIKSEEAKFEFGNPRFEDVTERKVGFFEGKTPVECWGDPLGRIILQHDKKVIETRLPHLSCERLPYHKEGKERFTFRFLVEAAGRRHVGTMGFDFDLRAGNPQPIVVNPSNEQADSPYDPPDELIEAFFEALPCSVLIRQRNHTLLYANSVYADLWGVAAKPGEMPPQMNQHYQRKEEPGGYDRGGRYKAYIENDELPGAAVPRVVVRFPLLNAFFGKAADASIGFDPSVLRAVKQMLAAVDVQDGAYSGMSVPLKRNQPGRGFVVEEADLQSTLQRAAESSRVD